MHCWGLEYLGVDQVVGIEVVRHSRENVHVKMWHCLPSCGAILWRGKQTMGSRCLHFISEPADGIYLDGKGQGVRSEMLLQLPSDCLVELEKPVAKCENLH